MRCSRPIPAQPVCARAGQHRHRQAQAPPSRSFTNRCLPALHFGAQPSCLPPARPGSTAGGRGNRGGTKATSWQTPPAPQRARTGMPGSCGRDPLRVPSGAVAQRRHRRRSRRQRPSHPSEMAAGAGGTCRGATPACPLPGARAAPAPGGERRDGTAPGEAAGRGRGSRRAPARRGAAPSLTCGPRVAPRSPRLRHLPRRCRHRVPPGPAGLAAPAAAAQAQCPPRHLTARRREGREGGPRPGPHGGAGPLPRWGRAPPSALRLRGCARAGGGCAALRAWARSLGLSLGAEQRALPGFPGRSSRFPRFFHPGVCARCLQPRAASGESMAPGKGTAVSFPSGCGRRPPTGSLPALQRQDPFVLGVRRGKINIIFVFPHHSHTSG